jgi:hypothetical protein
MIKITDKPEKLAVAKELLGFQTSTSQEYKIANKLKFIFLNGINFDETLIPEMVSSVVDYAELTSLFKQAPEEIFNISPLFKLTGFEKSSLRDKNKIESGFSSLRKFVGPSKRELGERLDDQNDISPKEIDRLFRLQLKKTLLILIVLDLEDPEEIVEQLTQNNVKTIFRLNALVLLFIAFYSLHLPDDQFRLYEGTTLKKTNCPESGAALFKCVNETKNYLAEILSKDSKESIDTFLKILDKIRDAIDTKNETDFQKIPEAETLASISTTLSNLIFSKIDMRELHKIDSRFADAVKVAKPATLMLERIFNGNGSQTTSSPENKEEKSRKLFSNMS